MRIVTNNLGVDITEKYAWEYLYKGLLFFCIGLFFSWYKLGKVLYKFTIWFGKFTWKIIEIVGKNYDKKGDSNGKKRKNKVNNN